MHSKIIMKSKLLKTFFLNTLFSSSLIILFLLIKEQITNYLGFLKETSPKLLEMQTALQTNATSNIGTLQSSLSQISQEATKFYLFYYILIPLVIFVLFVLFQGLIFYFLSNSKDLKKYMIRFITVTIPFYLLLLLIIKFFNIYLLIPLFFVGYYLIILYLNLNNPLKQALKKSLNLNIKLFLIYILLIILLVLYLVAKFLLIISLIGWINIIAPLLTLLLFIFLFSLAEIWFSKKVIT